MNVTDAVTVKFKLKLSQLIDVVSEYSAGNILSAVDIIYFLEKYLLFKTQIYLFLI